MKAGHSQSAPSPTSCGDTPGGIHSSFSSLAFSCQNPGSCSENPNKLFFSLGNKCLGAVDKTPPSRSGAIGLSPSFHIPLKFLYFCMKSAGGLITVLQGPLAALSSVCRACHHILPCLLRERPEADL